MRDENQPNLKLDLAYSRLTIHQLEQALNKIKDEDVVVLDLRGNDLEYEGCKILVKFLKYNNTVKKLLLSVNNIGDKQIKLLSDFLENNQSIQYLSLCGNNVGVHGIKYLMSAIKKSGIKYLDISANDFGDDGVAIVADTLSFNCFLESIDLSANKITSNGMKVLVNGLKNNKYLKTLILDLNNVDNLSMKALEELLKYNNCLEKLSLRECNILASVNFFCEAIEGSNLLELNIQGNNIGSIAFEKIVYALQGSSIKVLNIDDNQIGSKGGRAIASNISKLTGLSLYGAGIGEKGGKAVIKAAKESSLTYLNLISNKMPDSCGELIIDLIRDKPSMTIYADDNYFSDDMVATLTECGVIGADC